MSWLYPPSNLDEATFVASPVRVTLANRANRQGARDTRRAAHSVLTKPVVVNQAQGPQGGILIQLVQPPRQARKTQAGQHGFLPPPPPPPPPRPIRIALVKIRPQVTIARLNRPVVVVDNQRYFGPHVTLAPQRRGRPQSRLPQVVYAAAALTAEPTKITLAPQRRGKPKSSLHGLVYDANIFESIRGYLLPRVNVPAVTKSKLSPPTALASPGVARPIEITLARIRPQVTISRLNRPVVVGSNERYFGPHAVFAPQRRGKPKSKLSAPTVVASEVSATFGGPRVRLVAPRDARGKTKSRLSPPAIQTALAVPSQVTLFPLLGRVPAVHSRLRPPETPARKPNAPLAVHLTYSRRGKPRSKLSPPAWTRSFGEIKVTLAPQRRGTPKSRLAPPAIQTYLAVPSLVSLFPLTNRVPAVHSKLPLVIVPPVVEPVGKVAVHLAYSRRGSGLSRLYRPVVVLDNERYFGPLVTLAPSKRGTPKSHLFPTTIVTQEQALYPTSVTLAPSRRPVAKSRLLPVPAAFQPVGEIKVTLAYSLRGKPKSKLRPPVVAFPFFARPTEITLARIRPRPTTHFLSPPADLVDTQDLGRIAIHLAYSRRGVAKSNLRKVVIPAAATEIYGPEITLAPTIRPPRRARSFYVGPAIVYGPSPEMGGILQQLVTIRPAPTQALLRPPAVVNAAATARPTLVVLAASSRGTPRSILYPPVPPETFRGIQVHLAPSFRGKPKPFYVRTPIARLAVELSGPEITLVRIRPPKTLSFLREPVRGAAQPKAEYDLKITLAPQRRGKPKSFLRPPAVVRAATPYFRDLPVTLAPQKRGQPKSFLRPPVVVQYFVARPTLVSLAPSRFPRPKSRLFGYVVPARVFAPIRVTLAPSRFPTPKSRLLPPAVVNAAFIQISPTVQFARITPPRVHSRLRPPAVVGAGVYFRGILVHLAYSVRGKPKSKLSYTAIAVEECYGDAMCGFDFAADVCGFDTGTAVIGSTSTNDVVGGTDAGATVEGASAPSGSVTGDDARREGC